MCDNCENEIQDFYDEWFDQYGYGKQQIHNSGRSKVRGGETNRTGDETIERETQWRWKDSHLGTAPTHGYTVTQVDWRTVASDELLEMHVNDIFDEALDVLISKHEDYGPSNISDSPGGPLVGLAVRLHDKVARLAHLTSTNRKPNHESLRDTFLDILNYAAIGILVLEGHWDKGDRG